MPLLVGGHPTCHLDYNVSNNNSNISNLASAGHRPMVAPATGMTIDHLHNHGVLTRAVEGEGEWILEGVGIGEVDEGATMVPAIKATGTTQWATVATKIITWEVGVIMMGLQAGMVITITRMVGGVIKTIHMGGVGVMTMVGVVTMMVLTVDGMKILMVDATSMTVPGVGVVMTTTGRAVSGVVDNKNSGTEIGVTTIGKTSRWKIGTTHQELNGQSGETGECAETGESAVTGESVVSGEVVGSSLRTGQEHRNG